VDAVKADAQVIRRLKEGLAATPVEDGNIREMLLPLRGSRYVVLVGIEESPDEHARRTLRGFYYLLERRLAGLPPAQRQTYVESLSRRFDVKMAFVTEAGIDLPEPGRRRVLAGELVGRDLEQDGERYFKRLDIPEGGVLKIGPLPRHPLLGFVNPILLTGCGLVFALVIFLWVRPLWRDMRSLDRSAAQFGEGNLEVRAQVRPRSGIGALAGTFNSMAKQIQGLVLRQRELTNTVSHELRTPISRLRFALELIAGKGLTPEQMRLVEGMRIDVEELNTLVEESLTYSRLTNARTPTLSPQRVNARSWLERTLHEPSRVERGIVPDCDIGSVQGEVVVDPQLMARAIKNVLRNAVSHARTAVRVSASDTAAGLSVCIEDDGPGIPEDQRQAIFEPFYRIDSSPAGARDRELGGYGLGLAIVHRICEWHGATVSVGESALGGAKFEIRMSESGQEGVA
jgi:signal transduction histidine kinase